MNTFTINAMTTVLTNIIAVLVTALCGLNAAACKTTPPTPPPPPALSYTLPAGWSWVDPAEPNGDAYTGQPSKDGAISNVKFESGIVVAGTDADAKAQIAGMYGGCPI